MSPQIDLMDATDFSDSNHDLVPSTSVFFLSTYLATGIQLGISLIIQGVELMKNVRKRRGN